MFFSLSLSLSLTLSFVPFSWRVCRIPFGRLFVVDDITFGGYRGYLFLPQSTAPLHVCHLHSRALAHFIYSILLCKSFNAYIYGLNVPDCIDVLCILARITPAATKIHYTYACIQIVCRVALWCVLNRLYVCGCVWMCVWMCGHS